jgi:hypothetical protein
MSARVKAVSSMKYGFREGRVARCGRRTVLDVWVRLIAPPLLGTAGYRLDLLDLIEHIVL